MTRPFFAALFAIALTVTIPVESAQAKSKAIHARSPFGPLVCVNKNANWLCSRAPKAK